jgi:hypothetical protein
MATAQNKRPRISSSVEKRPSRKEVRPFSLLSLPLHPILESRQGWQRSAPFPCDPALPSRIPGQCMLLTNWPVLYDCACYLDG